MTTVSDSTIDACEQARARLRKQGKPILTLEQLYGPGPGPDDPEDLEAFLAFLAEHRRPAHIPDEANEAEEA